MLLELSIENLAIIEHLRLSFASGFNVLSGETGAGKSIIVGAVGALLGGRADSGLVRAGCDKLRIESLFHLEATEEGDSWQAVAALLGELDIPFEEGQLILSREIQASGRSISRLNSRAVPQSLLQRVGQRLLDLHGQGEHQSLLRSPEHLEFLDRYAGLTQERRLMREKVGALRLVRQQLRRLVEEERERLRRTDLLRFQLGEIRAAALRPGEEEELSLEHRLLASAELLARLSHTAYSALHQSEDGRPSVLDSLGEVVSNLRELSRLDTRLGEWQSQSETLSLQLEELARALRSYRDQVECDPARLVALEERLDLLRNLKRKYGDSVQDILEYGERAAQELEEITQSEERRAALQEEERELLAEIGRLAGHISQVRKRAARELECGVEGELGHLQMGRTRFAVQIAQREAPDGVLVTDGGGSGGVYAFDEKGIDAVEFQISANPGEPMRPLANVASGGETSRLMLAMKTALSHADPVGTLIFDEIDAGLGGRTGRVLGEKLWRIGRQHQVICVTHLPQIACFADAHFRVYKELLDGRTQAKVQRLSEEEREEELALMLGGLTPAARRNAQEMLERVEEWKGKQSR